jgi:hypothetical protein
MKKGCFLIFFAPAILLSLTGCAASLSRQEASRMLEAIRLKTTPTDFVEPNSFSIDTTIKQEGSSVSVSCAYSLPKHYFHYKYSSTPVSSSSLASQSFSNESWFYVDPYSTISIYVAYTLENGLETSRQVDDTDAVASWTERMNQSDLQTKLLTYFSDLSGVPQALETVISSLSSGDTESYSSLGSGSLDLSIKASSKTYNASFKDYLVTENDVTEGTSSTKVSYYWNNAKIYYPEFSENTSSSETSSGNSQTSLS